MPVVAGKLLVDGEVREGWVEAEGGKVVDSGDGPPPRQPDASGWILAAPVNAHTHVADACLRGRPGMPRTVPELVGPGGWKQKQLAAAAHDDLRQGVVRYAEEMAALGTTTFIDFRETGLAGVTFLKALAPDLAVTPFVMGRPTGYTFNDTEAVGLLREADGIGLSAYRDFDNPLIVEQWAEATHKARKPFALHASEAKREDIESILALDPSFLVHCTQATRSDLTAIADAGVPVVVCPRSNAYFGIKTPLDRMLDAGLELAVGTDNGMLCDGDLLAELQQLAAWYPQVPRETLLAMLTRGRALVGQGPLSLRRGAPADLVVLPERPWGDASGKPGFTVPP